jgi:cytochrome b
MQGRIKVWDPFVRVFHWTVVVAFFVAYFTEDELLALHVWAGYAIGVLVILRIVWGVTGTRHARFSDFVRSPRVSWRYLLDLLAFRAERHLGHSPAGGAMVLVLLTGLLATVWSGLELYAVEENAGPLAGISAPAGSESAWSSMLDVHANEDRDEDDREHGGEEESDSLWREIHKVLADLVLYLVFLHVAGVILASVAHRENLVSSMFSGTKRAP